MVHLSVVVTDLPLRVLCGQLLVGGFSGHALTASFAKALADGERAGAILFKRNLTGDLVATARLNAALRDASRSDLPPLLAVDQEGGRVARIGAPALVLPPMRTLGATGDAAFIGRVAEAQAVELAALGFSMNFAPILDVHTRADNPVIGDRAFASDPDTVARLGVAYAEGLARGGVMACGKHFPGHGDTNKDSHLDLPLVDHDRARLDAVEIVPFRAAARAGIAALMTAHVLFPALDPGVPATLSRAVCTDLRREIGFEGVLISDDLEMKAVADTVGVEASAVRAIDAGCDLLLVCTDEELQARAHEALVRHAERDAAFRARCVEAATRVLKMRRAVCPSPVTDRAALLQIVGGQRSQAIAAEIAARTAS